MTTIANNSDQPRDTRGRYSAKHHDADEINLASSDQDHLASSGDTADRICAALSSSSREVLVILAFDGEPTVRAAVAQNPDTTEELLELLVKDVDEAVADAATHNLGKSDEYRRRNRDWLVMLHRGAR
ncbi:MAG: hypothetical protein HIU88_12680 [Acidobacteria bacterium]|nr:hypothetical protein [Acidobacteriota bacterium]